jgi:putative SOS response-associated peptidase YedK
VPFWAKDERTADNIRMKTFNAKAETIFEKPSFRTSIKTKRCLVLVDGFFEWQHISGNKYPYYIRKADESAFALAGIWDSWENKNTGEEERTFSIITTEANTLLAQIHNTKKRMPVILKQADEQNWLSEDLGAEEIKTLLLPYDGDDLEAHTVSKLITTRGKNKNLKEVQEEFEYEELKAKQSKL